MDELGWKRSLRQNRVYLVTNVDFTNTELWDDVQAKGIISAIQVSSIKSDNNANYKQVSAFIDHLLKKTKADYDKFIVCLEETGQEAIVEYLNKGGRGQQNIRYAPVPAYQASSGFVRTGYGPTQGQHTRPQEYTAYKPSSVQPFDGSESASGAAAAALPAELPTKVPVPAPGSEIMTVKELIKDTTISQNIKCTKEWYEKQSKETKCYGVRHAFRGRAIVITMTGDRDGWKADVENIAKMLKYLKLDPQFEFDLTYKEYRYKLKEFAQCPHNGDVDCAWVILMGHGDSANNLDHIVSRDNRPVYIKATLEEMFNNKICRSLQQKPKAFILQMCRGVDADLGVSVAESVQADALAGRVQADALPSMQLSTFTDYVFGYATQQGKVSLRNMDKGSWYIQKLTEVFMEKAAFTSVSDMLTEVNREVQGIESDGGRVQTAETTQSLRYKWYLCPGYNPQQNTA